MTLVNSFVGALLRTMLALPHPLKRALAGAARRSDGLELDLDAQLIARVDALMPALGKGEPGSPVRRSPSPRFTSWSSPEPTGRCSRDATCRPATATDSSFTSTAAAG